MPSWLVVQHQDDCPPGVLADWAAERAIALDVVHPRALPDDLGEYDAICVLGSDRSVNDPRSAPELDWLRGALTAKPVLGICFGAQALALALGGSVQRETPEIDWLTLDVDDTLGCGSGPWLAWHNDFITPPADAVVLARSARAVHAFRSGCHLAIQFHPEVTAEIVDEWMRADELGRDLANAGVDHAALAARSADCAPAAAAQAHRLFSAWWATAARPR